MAVNFPNTPSPNQIYSYDGKAWQWNGNYWAVYSGLTSYVSGAGTADYIPKWSNTNTITNSQITDDGVAVGIPNANIHNLNILTQATWSPPISDINLFNKNENYNSLYVDSNSTSIYSIANEGILTSDIKEVNDTFVLFQNSEDHRSIQFFYSITSEDGLSIRSGNVIANWDYTYTNFYQTEYGPKYMFDGTFSVDVPLVQWNGSNTEISIYLSGYAGSKALLKMKYILL